MDTWPPHGVAGTAEAELHPALAGLAPDASVKKGEYVAAYSGFEGVDAEGRALAHDPRGRGDHGRRRGRHRRVALRARHHARRARPWDCGARVLTDLTVPVSPGAGAAARAAMAAAGASWSPRRSCRPRPGQRFFAASAAAYRSRFGTPAAVATSATASLSRSPRVGAGQHLGHEVGGRGSTAPRPHRRRRRRSRRAPGRRAAHAASSASGPRTISSYVLVSSRHTAAGRSGAERLGHRRERVVQPVRRLEEDHRAALVGQQLERPGALARLARREALEAEPVGRQAGQGERGQHGARSGRRRDRQPGGDGGADHPEAGVGHGRHAGVRHDDDGAARRRRPSSSSADALDLVVLVEADAPGRRSSTPSRAASARSRRVSSAATTSASASSRRRCADASSALPIGVAASTRRPGVCADVLVGLTPASLPPPRAPSRSDRRRPYDDRVPPTGDDEAATADRRRRPSSRHAPGADEPRARCEGPPESVARHVATRLLRRLLGDDTLALDATPRARLTGWLWPLAVTVLAAVLRFWDLGRRTSSSSTRRTTSRTRTRCWSTATRRTWDEDPNPQFEAGDTSGLDARPPSTWCTRRWASG